MSTFSAKEVKSLLVLTVGAMLLYALNEYYIDKSVPPPTFSMDGYSWQSQSSTTWLITPEQQQRIDSQEMRYRDQEKITLFSSPQAWLQSGQSLITLQAKSAELSKQQLALHGAILLQKPLSEQQTLSLKSEHLYYDIATQQLHTKQPVTLIYGNQMRTEAVGMDLDLAQQHLKLNSAVHTTLYLTAN